MAGEAELSAARTAAQFRGLVRELERIRRIADSAAASLAGGRSGASLPRTTSEAYAVLGVNADASAHVLKKIVDALRMSWHPDHARGDDDRRLREERIRQINIAWELINATTRRSLKLASRRTRDTRPPAALPRRFVPSQPLYSKLSGLRREAGRPAATAAQL